MLISHFGVLESMIQTGVEIHSTTTTSNWLKCPIISNIKTFNHLSSLTMSHGMIQNSNQLSHLPRFHPQRRQCYNLICLIKQKFSEKEHKLQETETPANQERQNHLQKWLRLHTVQAVNHPRKELCRHDEEGRPRRNRHLRRGFRGRDRLQLH